MDARQILKDITWLEWLVMIALSALIAWAAMYPFVDFLTNVK